ncbi:hypothetical protein LSAT2_005684, partial [Lamellibrachia satsuma]
LVVDGGWWLVVVGGGCCARGSSDCSCQTARSTRTNLSSETLASSQTAGSHSFVAAVKAELAAKMASRTMLYIFMFALVYVAVANEGKN